MIVLHSDTDFSATNMFQFDWELKRVDHNNPSLGLKKTQVIQNIKKLFNFDCNDYVTLVKGTIVTVLMPDKAFECEVINTSKVMVIRELEINIQDILKKLKNGRITG